MLKTNNKVIKKVSSLPSSGDTNSIYYNTTDGFYYGWNSVTNQFDNLSKGGDPISVYIQSSSSTKPSPAVESDTLIITDNGLATGTITEQWIYSGSQWIQLPNDKVLDVLTTAQTPPNLSGTNTTNLGKIFKDASANTYIVDYNGEAIQLSSPDVVTDITSITNGFRYTNESNQNDDITFEVNNTDPQNVKVEVKLNGTKVAEFPLYTVNNDIQINNSGSEWDLTDDKITILETNGDSQTITFPYRVTVVANPNGTIDIKQNGVTIGTIPAPAADIKYSKALFVDPINGSDTVGTGSDNNMFKTIAKALTVADGSGFRIVLAPGVYAENPTISLPNLDIVTLAGSDRGNTSINGTVTFTHTSSSSGIQGISMNRLNHTGAGALYVTDCQINSAFDKTSTGYIEITGTQLQGTSASTLNAGTGLIKDSLIKNMTISGASSGYTLKSNIIDADGLVEFLTGAFYNIQDNSGNIVTTAGVNMETGLIASGLSAALAKQYVTDFSNKLGMINPDTNATPTKFVTWNETTKRLEISNTPSGGAIWYSGTNTPTATGNTAASLGVATLPANYFNTTTGDQFYIDANGVSRLIQEGFLTTSLTAVTGNGTAFVGASNTALATVADQMRLSDGSIVDDVDVTWTGHGLTVHAWYYLDSVTGGYTTVKPTSGFIQQLFFVKDANTIHIDVEQAAEVQSATSSSATWTTATTDPTATGNVGGPKFVENTVNGSKWYIDSTGVAKLIEGAADVCGTVFFDTLDPATATIFDDENPPITNDNALKNLDCAVYISAVDGSVWSSNGTVYKTKTYSAPTHRFTRIVSTAGQTVFTLPSVPIGSTTLDSQRGIVHVTRNGIDISRAVSWVGAVGTYIPSINYNCTIDANDILHFHWEAI